MKKVLVFTFNLHWTIITISDGSISVFCDEIHVQFTLDDNNNAVSLLPVGSLFDLGNGYQLYYAPEQYPNYCFFTNEGDSFNFGFLFTDNGSDLYVGSGSFVWNKGYPGK